MGTLRLLFVAPDFGKPYSAEGLVNRKLAKALGQRGFATDVISQGTHHTVQVLRQRGGAENPPSPPPERPSQFALARYRAGRLLGEFGWEQRSHWNETCWSYAATLRARELLTKARYDILLSSGEYGHLTARRISRRCGLPWIAIWNDPFPARRYPPPYGQGPDAPVVTRQSQLLETIGAYASWHIFPTERLRRYMLEYLPEPVGVRSSVIPHVCIDGEPHAAPPKGAVFTLCHAGDLHEQRRAEAFLSALATLRRNLRADHSLLFQFVGEDQAGLKQEAARLGLSDSVRCSTRVPYEECRAVVCASHVLVVIEAPLSEGIFLPAKFVDYLEAGQPILAVSPTHGVLAELLSRHRGGLAVDCTDPDAISAALGTLYGAWVEGTLHNDYRSDTLRNLFCESAVVNQYAALFDRLLAQPGAFPSGGTAV